MKAIFAVMHATKAVVEIRPETLRPAQENHSSPT